MGKQHNIQDIPPDAQQFFVFLGDGNARILRLADRAPFADLERKPEKFDVGVVIISGGYGIYVPSRHDFGDVTDLDPITAYYDTVTGSIATSGSQLFHAGKDDWNHLPRRSPILGSRSWENFSAATGPIPAFPVADLCPTLKRMVDQCARDLRRRHPR